MRASDVYEDVKKVFNESLSAAETEGHPDLDSSEGTENAVSEADKEESVSSNAENEPIAEDDISIDSLSSDNSSLSIETKNQEDTLEAPRHWSAEDRRTFSSATREQKEFLLRRHNQMENAFREKTKNLSENIKFADSFREALKPYEGYLNALSIKPEVAVQKLLATEYQLRNGSQSQKYFAAQQLLNDYGIDLGAFQGNANDQDMNVDPRSLDGYPYELAQQVAHLYQRIDQYEQKRIEDEQYSLQSSIEKFANAMDSAGNIKHPHFQELREDMGQLLQLGKASDLEEAYEKAINMNPEFLRQKIEKEFAQKNRLADSEKKKEMMKNSSFHLKQKGNAAPQEPEQVENTRDMVRRLVMQAHA